MWKARDTSLRRLVALKLPRLQDMTDAERARFRREGQACAQLHHPNIVAVYQVGDEQGRCYIASELIEGWSLREWLVKQGRISHVEAVTLTAQLADALQHAHEKGVIHRDLKPANVLIDHQGSPHLTDFGLRTVDRPKRGPHDGGPRRRHAGVHVSRTGPGRYGSRRSADRRVRPGCDCSMKCSRASRRLRASMASVIQRVINVEPAAPAKVDAQVPRDSGNDLPEGHAKVARRPLPLDAGPGR